MRTGFDIRSEISMAREEGLEEGREEEQNRIASVLKSMVMSVDDITKATGLKAEAIAAL